MKHAVVIDPDAVSRDALASLLQEDYVLQTASDVEEAVVSMRFRVPDVILTELADPPLVHLHTLRDNWPGIPIIVVTSKADPTTAVESMKWGVHDYLLKPVKSAQLWTAIRSAGSVQELITSQRREVHATDGLIARGLTSYLQIFQKLGTVLAFPPTGLATCERMIQIIRHALDCQVVDLLVRRDQAFQPFGQVSMAPFPANHPIISYLARNRTPLRLDEVAGLGVIDETSHSDLLALPDLELLVPVFDGDDLIGLLALGANRMGTPYSALDLEVLLTVATLMVPLLRSHTPGPVKQHQEHLAALVQALPLAAMLVDESHTIRVVTGKLQSLTGHMGMADSPVSLLGHEVAERVSGTNRTLGQATVVLQNANGTSTEVEMQTYPLEGSATLVCFALEQSFHEMRQHLMETLRTWSMVASEITHRIRNTMVPVQMFLDTCAESETVNVPENLQEAASQAVTELGEFIEDIATFMESPALERQYCDVNILLAKAIARVKRGSVTGSGLDVQYTEPMPAVLVDREMLQQALERLIQYGLSQITPGESLHVLSSLLQSPDSNDLVSVLLAYPQPPGRWADARASHWDIMLASIAKVIMDHGGAFYTHHQMHQIEHHIRFAVE